MPRSNSFWASALHEVAKWTLPSLSSSDWEKTGEASGTPANTVTSKSDAFSMIRLLFSRHAMASGTLRQLGRCRIYHLRRAIQISPPNRETCYSGRIATQGCAAMPTPDPGLNTGLTAATSALPADLIRALDWLRGHLSEPVQLDRLAEVSGVAPRTLERHFREFLGTTPLGWTRRMRLARARQALLRAGPEDTVTDIALSNGFAQLGRFAAEYRGAFGELPSRTMRASERAPRDGGLDEAMRLTLIALPFAFAVAPKQCNTALEEIGRPQELAPGYGLPKAVAAWCWGQRASHRFSSTPDRDRALSLQLADEAYQLAPNDALTLTLSSGALVLARRLDEADRSPKRALALAPWLAYAWIRRGWMSAYLGDRGTAIRELSTALHLMPFEP